MPTHNKKPFEPAPNPLASPTDDVFQLWPTGEIFTDYHHYIDALWSQRTPKWTCTVTGKTGLSLPEAMASEEAARASLEEMPLPWRRLAASTIHHSLHSLNHAASLVYEQSKSGLFLEGEEVSVELNGEQVFGRITRISSSLDVGAEVVKLALYKDDQLSEWIGEGTVIGMSCLTRIGKQKTITKALIKKYMRSIAQRDTPFLPWIVKEKALREEFGLAEELPEGMRVSSVASKKKRVASEQEEEEEQSVVELEFPMEDLLIPPDLFMPLVDYSLFKSIQQEYPKFTDHLFADSLTIWSFLNSFSKHLNLSPFSFDDWQSALVHHQLTDLVEESVFVLFEHICKRRQSSSRQDFCQFISSVFVPFGDGDNTLDQLEVSKKNTKWFELGSWRQLGMNGCLCGFVEEVSITLGGEFDVDFSTWTLLAHRLKSLKRSELLPIGDLLFLCRFLLTSLAVTHQADLKAVVDAEVDRMDTLRDKLKDLQVEQTAVQEEIAAFEKDLSSSDIPEDSKERRKLESNLRKARQNLQLLDKKRENWERDIRKAGWLHRCERLGLDRDHRQYWWLDGWRAVGANHNSCGRLFIESDNGWFLIDTADQLALLIASLNHLGIRESRLKQSLVDLHDHMISCFTPSTVPDEDEKKRGGIRKTEPSFLRYRNKL